MAIIIPHITTPQEQYEDQLWLREECYRFYVQQRREHCNFLELLHLWLRAPYCESCIQSQPDASYDLPEISGDNWQVDILCHLGGTLLEYIEDQRVSDADFSLICKKCGRALRPWSGDDIFIVDYHLEEHYGIPMETPAKQNPSKRVRKKILSLYHGLCFKCGSKDDLHIDHIMPQSHGGDAAFRNLQPLCDKCGEEKGDQLPNEVTVYSTMYFEKLPADSYEGLFW